MDSQFDDMDAIITTGELLCMKVFTFLRDAIIQEKIKPGEKLNVVSIASRLGVSRSPVREAIRMLEAHDFIESIPQKGAFVKQITYDEIQDLFIVLKSLLSTAAKFTAANLDAESRKELNTIVKELNKAKKTMENDSIIEVTRHFHNFVVGACGNRLLFKLHESILTYREKPYLLMKKMKKQDLMAILDEPLGISAAILKGDADGTERLMYAHMENAGARTIRALANI